MTNQQFLDSFYLQADVVATLNTKGFEPSEITNMANRAMEALIIKKVRTLSNANREGFEETEKRTQELGELVRYKSITNFTTGFFENGKYVILPNTLIDTTNAETTNPAGSTNYDDVYWLTVYEDAITDILDCFIKDNDTIYERATVIEANHSQIGYMLIDPFNKPNSQPNNFKVLRLRSSGRKHELITDGNFNITAYKIGYIKKPKPIDLTGTSTDQVCELSDLFHRELLDETVIVALKDTTNIEQLKTELTINKE